MDCSNFNRLLADKLHNFVAALVLAGVIGALSVVLYIVLLRNQKIEVKISGGLNNERIS